MDLAAVGVSPREIAEAEPFEGPLDAVIPDASKVSALRVLVEAGQSELQSLKGTSEQFQRELQQLAGEMKELETKSGKLYQKVDSRNKALEVLEPLVKARVVPPAIVGELCFGDIGGPQWRAALAVSEQQAGKNDSELLTKLRLKVLHRIKDYYVSRVRRLRSPGVDAQTVQQDLINNAALYKHLLGAHQEIAVTIKQAYISTIRWYYQMLLEKYLRWIGRQVVIPSDKSSTIGNTLFTTKSFFSSFSSSGGPESSSNQFNVGARPTILSKEARPLAWGTAAPTAGFHVEVLVHSLVAALVDAITMEDRVLREAFGETEPEQVLGKLFSDTLDHASQILDKLFGSWDVFDLLLSLKVLESAEGPAIFTEWRAKQTDKVWTSVQRIIEGNSRSIEAAIARPAANRKTGPELHSLTTTVASMLTGVLQLSGDAKPVLASIRQFIAVYEASITKLSKSSSSPELFLYNNYFLLSSLIGDLQGSIASELSQHFTLLTDAYKPST